MSGIPFADIVNWLSEDGHLVDQVTVIGAPFSQSVTGACVDSRLAQPGCLFVALPGARTDGHNFVDQAVQGGATAALVASERLASVRQRVFGSVRLIPVDDTLAALQSLALRWRQKFPGLTRVGITGSNGKTTTKELLASILALAAPTIHSHGNYNSDIGLPVELLRIREEHRYGVFEMGMNRPGEMRLLAELVDPNVALITNIGRAHVGMVGSEEAIAREKREIFALFSGAQRALVPAGDRYADFLAEGVEGEVVRYSMESAGVTDVQSRGIDGSRLICTEGVIELHLPGAPMVQNAIGVLTAARLLNVPFAAMREGIERVEPVFGRSEIIRGEVTIIQDCYNANPESMRSALELLAGSRTVGRRVAVIGAMKELGDLSPGAHREMLELAGRLGLDSVFAVGDEFVSSMKEIQADSSPGHESPGLVRTFGYDEWNDLVDALGDIRAGDLVLLKGSRALALERLTPVVSQAGGRV